MHGTKTTTKSYKTNRTSRATTSNSSRTAMRYNTGDGGKHCGGVHMVSVFTCQLCRQVVSCEKGQHGPCRPEREKVYLVTSVQLLQPKLHTHGPLVMKRGSSIYPTGGGGGFFLACEDFGRMFDQSFPACAFSSLFLSGDEISLDCNGVS